MGSSNDNRVGGLVTLKNIIVVLGPLVIDLFVDGRDGESVRLYLRVKHFVVLLDRLNGSLDNLLVLLER